MRAVECIGERKEDNTLFPCMDAMKKTWSILMPDIPFDSLRENVNWRYVTVLMHPKTGDVNTAEGWEQNFATMPPEKWGGEKFEDAGLFEVEWNGKEWKAVTAQ